MLQGMYGPDYVFKMDNRWFVPKPCNVPLTDECVRRFIDEHFYPGVKVVGKTAFWPQTLGNDFFFSNADFTFKYLDGLRDALTTKGA